MSGIERRKFDRRVLEELAARLYRSSDGTEVDYCPINVSQQGISVFTSFPLPVGAEFTLVLGAKDVNLVVCWCQPKENDPALYRCGLGLVDAADQLDVLIKSELAD